MLSFFFIVLMYDSWVICVDWDRLKLMSFSGIFTLSTWNHIWTSQPASLCDYSLIITHHQNQPFLHQWLHLILFALLKPFALIFRHCIHSFTFSAHSLSYSHSLSLDICLSVQTCFKNFTPHSFLFFFFLFE